MIKSNSVYCLIEEEKKWERDGRGSHFTRSGTGQESFLTLARDWDGTRFFSVGVGWDRSENPLPCQPLVCGSLRQPVACGRHLLAPAWQFRNASLDSLPIRAGPHFLGKPTGPHLLLGKSFCFQVIV